MINRIPIVGVMGSGVDEYPEKTRPLGQWLAESGFHLLTGGGGGVMSAVSKAFCDVKVRKGLSIGVIPTEDGRPKPGYPNPWIEIPIVTHLPLSGRDGMEKGSRNHINVLSADVLVALPGGYGTSSEVELALKYQKPVIAFIDHSEDIPKLPIEIIKTDRFQVLTEFILSEIG
jgi:uncharacterized protein (TIGR00725 family)